MRRPRARTRTRAGRWALGMGALLLLVGPVPLATAQSDAAEVRLVVADLEAVVGLGSSSVEPGAIDPTQLATAGTLRATVLVSNEGSVPLDAVELVVEVHDRVETRAALRAALDGPGPEDAGRVVLERDLDTLAAGAVGQELVEVLGATAGWASQGAGTTVHPVVLSLVRGSLVLDQVRTAVVWVEAPPATPLPTTVVLPLATPPGQLFGGTDPGEALRPGAALDRLVTTLEASPAGLVVPAVDVAVLEDLQAAAAGTVPGAEALLERLLTAVAEGPAPASQAYATADIAALASDLGTAELAARAVAEGRRRLRPLAGRGPGSTHLADGPQSPASVDLVPSDVLVVRWDAAAGPDLTADPSADLPSAVRTTRTPSGRRLAVLVADPWVTDLLGDADGRQGWPVEAQRVLADTALLHAEAPDDEARALVVVPPTGWDAPGDLGPLLVDALGDATWLSPTGPGVVAGLADTLRATAWAPVPMDSTLPSSLLPALASTSDRLLGLTAALATEADATTEPATTEPVVDLDAATDDLLRAATTWPDAGVVPSASARVQTVRSVVDTALGTVDVPADAAVTLTSERGEIPVTLRHPEGTGIEVLVEVAGQGRLTFDDGNRRLVRLDEGGTSTVTFSSTALGRGTFPVVVTVSTPDGTVELERAVLSVRATAVSRTALLAVGLVVLVLLLLGGRHRRRGPDGPRLEVVGPPR